MDYLYEDMSKKSRAKDAIIEILGKEWPLSAKKIFFRIKKEHNLGVTYQAVHKALNQLKKKKVLQQKNKEYLLSLEWLENLKSFSEEVGLRYFAKEYQNSSRIISFFEKTRSIEFSFENMAELGDFIIKEFMSFPNPRNKPSYFRWRHMYNLIGLSPELIEILASQKNEKRYIVCAHKDPFDKFLKKSYEEMRGKVKLGVNCSRSHDTFTRGDFELRVFWPYELLKERDNYYKNFKELNIEELRKILHKKGPKIKISILYSPSLMEKVKEETLKHFKE